MTDLRIYPSLPRGLRNNNPLNIRRNPANRWQGLAPESLDDSFCTFISLEYGARAALKLIRNYLIYPAFKCKTPADIIKRWAPPSENDTAAYIARVETISGVTHNKPIKFSERAKVCAIARAMAIVECGVTYTHYLTIDLFRTAYDML